MTTKPKATEVKEQSAEQVKAEAVKVADKAAKAEPTTAAKTGESYGAQWTLYHDGKRYKAGDTLTLSAEQAAPLVDAGVLVALK